MTIHVYGESRIHTLICRANSGISSDRGDEINGGVEPSVLSREESDNVGRHGGSPVAFKARACTDNLA